MTKFDLKILKSMGPFNKMFQRKTTEAFIRGEKMHVLLITIEFNLTENLLRDYARSDTKHPESAGNEERARFQREDLGHSGRCTEQKDKVSRNSSGLHPCGRHTAIRNTQTDTRSINPTGCSLHEFDLV